MPITINGTGSVTGISAGGLPDGSVTLSDLAPGVSSKVLLGTYTASDAATLDATGWYSSAYEQYEIELVGVFPISNNNTLNLRLSNDNGATYDSGSNYTQTALLATSASPFSATSASQTTAALAGAVSNNTSYGVSSTMKMLNKAGAFKTLYINLSYLHVGATTPFVGTITQYWNNTSVCNAIRLYFTTGNITGTVRIYGIGTSTPVGTPPLGPVFVATKDISQNYALPATTGTIIFPFKKTIGSFDSSGYNTSTGVFTAPTSGLYFFSVTLAVLQAAAFGDLGFYVNGSGYLDGVPLGDYSGTQWRSLTLSTHIYLNSSDTCSAARLFNGGATAANTSWRGSFTGRLVAV